MENAAFKNIVFLGEARSCRRAGATFGASRAGSAILAQAEQHSVSGRYGEIFRWLCEERGLAADRYRPSAVLRRERACFRVLGSDRVSDLRPRAAVDLDLVERGLGAVLIGVTSFFRDAQAFQALKRELMSPACPLRRRELTVLSVACSDGMELYSAGMLLAEADLLGRATLYGLDCRESAIERGRAGVYPIAAIETLDESARLRWFEVSGGFARIRPALRERTRWIVGDAFRFSEPKKADLICCRNFAIYLRPDAANQLWRSLAERLAPGGLLMVGKAERPTGVEGFARIGPCLYRKIGA